MALDRSRASNPDRAEARSAYWVWTSLFLRFGAPSEKFAIRYATGYHLPFSSPLVAVDAHP